jgi:hypothetical protein
MGLWLKQSTSVTVKVGPFFAKGDGDTVLDSLTITQPDVRLTKNGGDFAQKAAAQTLAHDEGGFYGLTLDTDDTDTLGRLKGYIHKSGGLCVWFNYMVVPANVWDSMFGSEKLETDVTKWNGTAVPAEDTAGYPICTVKDGTGAGEIDTSSGAIVSVTAVSGSVGSVTGAVGSVTGNVGGNVVGSVASVTASVGLTAAAVSDIWDELLIGHSTPGSSGKILYDLATMTFPTPEGISAVVWAEALPGSFGAGEAGYIVGVALDAAVSSRSTFDWTSDTVANVTTVASVSGSVGSVTAAVGLSAAAVDDIWRELIADHSGVSGSMAEALSNASSAGDPWSTALPGAYGAGTAGAVIGNMLDDLFAKELSFDTKPGFNTVEELFVSTRAHVMGTRVGIGDTEVGLMADRSTVAYSRLAKPVGGPYTHFHEATDYMEKWLGCEVGSEVMWIQGDSIEVGEWVETASAVADWAPPEQFNNIASASEVGNWLVFWT